MKEGKNLNYTCAGPTTRLFRCISCNTTEEYTVMSDGKGSWIGELSCTECSFIIAQILPPEESKRS